MLTRSFMRPGSSQELLTYTPMLHARMFRETTKFRDHHFQPTRAGLEHLPSTTAETSHSDVYLDGNTAIDRPLFVQFCANSPDEILEAAKYVQPFCDAVDLNLGCPQGIAKKGRYGAFLQEDWDLIYRIINKLHIQLDVPVTAKIRILETKEKTLEYAKLILSAGASIITVHGRQRDQKGHKTGLADWSVLRYLRDNLPKETVIFANGNILRHEDITRCLEETGADGVMSAEGNLYDPTIFAKPSAAIKESREYWQDRYGRGGYRVDAVFRRYMGIVYEYILERPQPERKPLFLASDHPEKDHITQCPDKLEEASDQPPAKKQRCEVKQVKATSPNLLSMQAHLFHLLRPLVTVHTNVRDALARCRAGDMAAFENVLSLVEQAVCEGLLEFDSDPAKFEGSYSDDQTKDDAKKHDGSSLATIRACKRPWWVCQPYVRPLPKEALERGSLTLSKKERQIHEVQHVERTSVKRHIGISQREKLDERDGMQRSEIPQESMVCG